jgi:hypothetical protein
VTEAALRYDVFGLCVESELALPELAPAPIGSQADVGIRRGRIAQRVGEVAGLAAYPDGLLLCIPDVGRYWMAGGREIIVDPAAGASERDVRLFLLGSALAGILHQRALLPLHANAVVIGGRAIAFMGHPGAGKSTLAAWFHDRGFQVLADDVCLVTWSEGGRALAHPGIPRLRLTSTSLAATGRREGDFESSFDDRMKFNVPTGSARGSGRGAVPIDHLYLLERAGRPEERAIERMTGSESVDALVVNTYRGGYLQMMGATGPHLLACVRLARTVPVYRSRRLWSLDAMSAEADAIEAHARRIIERANAAA